MSRACHRGSAAAAPAAGSAAAVAALVCAALALAGVGLRAAHPQSAPAFPHQWLGDIDQIAFDEPSGIVFHPGRGTLFVVGDDGDLAEIHTDGTLVRWAHLRDADLEGITVNPATGLLYLAVEGQERILEVEPDGFAVRREFAVPRTYQGRTILRPGGNGLEGITFVPVADHAQGGYFLVSNQSFDLTDGEELSAILRLEVPVNSSDPADSLAAITAVMELGVIDLAGLHYDVGRDVVLVVSDAEDRLLLVQLDGTIAAVYRFPGQDQEGITTDLAGHLFIAQDSGGIIKTRWLAGD